MYLCFLAFAAYGQFLKANGEQPVTWKRASSMEEVLQEADVVIIYIESAQLDFLFTYLYIHIYWILIQVLILILDQNAFLDKPTSNP